MGWRRPRRLITSRGPTRPREGLLADLMEVEPVRASISSVVLTGIEAIPCRVEIALLDDKTVKTTIVGLPDTAVKESIERVRAAMDACGLPYPPGRVTISLAPAALRKEGPQYDLPIAIGLLVASGYLDQSARGRVADTMVIGELALNGSVNPVRGGVAVAELARRIHVGQVLMPSSVASIGALVPGVRVLPVSNLSEAVDFFNGTHDISPATGRVATSVGPGNDLSELRGQALPRRALMVAAAGWHNLLMIGPPGTGKTSLARCLPGILPTPRLDESLEMARIASIAGTDEDAARASVTRPFRAPHHTASAASIVGGGTRPRPGEITLAHQGVLFLDELPEFQRGALEALREPLERDEVVIARAAGRATFPSRVLLVAAMNPTRRGGGRPGLDGSLDRLSGPLLDRIDMHVEVPPIPVEDLDHQKLGQSSGEVRQRVERAWRVQQQRQGVTPNGRLKTRQLDALASLKDDARRLLREAVEQFGLSARAWDRIRRIARTLADLDEVAQVDQSHIAEAVQYRWLDRAR